MISSILKDGLGHGYKASVNEHNELLVAVGQGDLPAVGSPNRYRFYTALLGSTGADSGTTNAGVNAGAAPQTFYVASATDHDIHIMAVNIQITDGSTSHSKFGAIAALANGVTLRVIESGVTTNIILAAKTGGDLIVKSGAYITQGDAATSFEVTDSTGTDDTTLVVIPLGVYIPGGLRLGMGTLDKLEFVVNDDISALTSLYIRVFGYRHYD